MPRDRSWRGRALVGDRLLAAACTAVIIAGLSTVGAVPLPQSSPTGAPSAESGPASDKEKAKLPPARVILDRHLVAIGGRAAILRHSSIVERGTLSMPRNGVAGEFVVFRAKPNKSLVRITLGGVGEVVEGFDGTHAWSHSPLTGPMLLDGKQLEEKRLDSEFYGELHDDRRYMSITTVEQTVFDGRPCYKVRFVRTTGSEDIAFYDVATGLKAGGVTTRETHMGTVTATAVEGGYRKFGDLLHATTVKNQMAGIEQVFTVTSVEYDNVPDAVFDMPSEIKALVK